MIKLLLFYIIFRGWGAEKSSRLKAQRIKAIRIGISDPASFFWWVNHEKKRVSYLLMRFQPFFKRRLAFTRWSTG